MQEILNFLEKNKEFIQIIGSIIGIMLFIWGIIRGIFKNITKEKIRIKLFGLKLEGGKNYQCFDFKNGKKVILQEEILKENFPRTLLNSNYNFPEFEVLIQNNSDKSYLIENFIIKVNEIYLSNTPLIGISFSGNEIWEKKDLKGKYFNLFFNFTNLGINKIYNLKIIKIIAYDENNKIIDLSFKNNGKKYNIDSGKTEKIEFELNNKNHNYNFSKLIFNIDLEKNGKILKHQLLYTLWEGNYEHLFHDRLNGFYMIPAEVGGGCFFSDDVGKFLIPTSLGFDKLKGKKLFYPLKRLIRTKNIDNFTFYLGTDSPCKVNIDLIFDFGNKKIIKNIIIDLNFPISFDLEEYKNNSKVLLLK